MFDTSPVKRVMISSQAAEWLGSNDLRKLGNIRKISELGGDKMQYPVHPPKVGF